VKKKRNGIERSAEAGRSSPAPSKVSGDRDPYHHRGQVEIGDFNSSLTGLPIFEEKVSLFCFCLSLFIPQILSLLFSLLFYYFIYMERPQGKDRFRILVMLFVSNPGTGTTYRL
jgi:hypothetical protein